MSCIPHTVARLVPGSVLSSLTTWDERQAPQPQRRFRVETPAPASKYKGSRGVGGSIFDSMLARNERCRLLYERSLAEGVKFTRQ